jgi:hypothetical protein
MTDYLQDAAERAAKGVKELITQGIARDHSLPSEEAIAACFRQHIVKMLERPASAPNEAARPKSAHPRRDWLDALRDAGPNGAAPDARHAALWGAILDLRGVRDAIENATGEMTARLDRLADETTLTHAIAAGWEPEDEPAREKRPDEARTSDDRSAEPAARGDVEELVDRAKDGLTALRTLWNASAGMPERPAGAVFSFGTSMEFVADSVEALLDEIAATVAPPEKRPDDSAAASPA